MFFQITVYVRKQRRKQAALPQHAIAVGAMARQEELGGLVKKSRRWHAGQQRAQLGNRLGARRVDFKAQFGFEPRRAQHAHRIFAVASLNVTDQSEALCLDVGQPAHVIPDREVGDVVIERVDREIAPPHVFVNAAVHVVAQQPAVIVLNAMARAARVATCGPCCATDLAHLEWLRDFESGYRLEGFDIARGQLLRQQLGFVFLPVGHRLFAGWRRAGGAKGRHFNHLAPIHDVRQPETPPYQATVAKQTPHLVGQGVGGDVKVLGVPPKDNVAHAAPDQESLKTGFFKPIQNAQGIGGNIGPRDRMIGARNDARRARRRGGIQVLVQINPDLA